MSGEKKRPASSDKGPEKKRPHQQASSSSGCHSSGSGFPVDHSDEPGFVLDDFLEGRCSPALRDSLLVVLGPRDALYHSLGLPRPRRSFLKDKKHSEVYPRASRRRRGALQRRRRRPRGGGKDFAKDFEALFDLVGRGEPSALRQLGQSGVVALWAKFEGYILALVAAMDVLFQEQPKFWPFSRGANRTTHVSDLLEKVQKFLGNPDPIPLEIGSPSDEHPTPHHKWNADRIELTQSDENEASRLLFGARCLFAHGDPERTISKSLSEPLVFTKTTGPFFQDLDSMGKKIKTEKDECSVSKKELSSLFMAVRFISKDVEKTIINALWDRLPLP